MRPHDALPLGRLVHSRVVEDPGEALAAALDRSLVGYAVFEPQDTLLLDADDAGVIAFREGVPVAAYHAGTDRGGAEALADLAVPGPYSADLYEVKPGELVPFAGPARLVPPEMAAERLAGDPDLADRTLEAAERHGIRGPGREPVPATDRVDVDGPTGGDPPDSGTDPVRTGDGAPGPGSVRSPAEEVPRDPAPDRDLPTDPPPRSGTGTGHEGADAVAAFLDDERKIEAIREQARGQARERADEWGLTEHLADDPDG